MPMEFTATSSNAVNLKLRKTVLNFLAKSLKSRSNFEHFEKKMTRIAYVFPKVKTANNVVS